MTLHVTPRPITAEEAAVVRAALERAPLEGDHSALLPIIDTLIVVGRCECGCASVDFESPVGTGRVAHGLGRTADGHDVGVIVWGDDRAIRGLEIYSFEKLVTDLPFVDSIRPFAAG